MPSIFGSMVVKNGIKQVIYNFSNARKKTYAQVQAMSDAEKQGVIICDDYPVSSAYGSYEKIADGTTLDQLKSTLSGMSVEDYLSTILRVVASDNNAGVYALRPFDVLSYARNYEYAKSPYNTAYATISWTLICNLSNDTIKYYQNNQPISAAMTQSEPAVSSWELYRLKV